MISLGIYVINAIILSSRIWFTLQVVQGLVEVAHRALDLIERFKGYFRKEDQLATV